MSYDSMCEKIMNIDESIRFVGVYTDDGVMACSRMRDNTPSMITQDQIQMSIYYAKVRHETREHLSRNIGKEEFSITKYEKVIRFTIPFENNLLLLSADTDIDYAKIVNEILKVINETKTS